MCRKGDVMGVSKKKKCNERDEDVCVAKGKVSGRWADVGFGWRRMGGFMVEIKGRWQLKRKRKKEEKERREGMDGIEKRYVYRNSCLIECD